MSIKLLYQLSYYDFILTSQRRASYYLKATLAHVDGSMGDLRQLSGTVERLPVEVAVHSIIRRLGDCNYYRISCGKLFLAQSFPTEPDFPAVCNCGQAYFQSIVMRFLRLLKKACHEAF